MLGLRPRRYLVTCEALGALQLCSSSRSVQGTLTMTCSVLQNIFIVEDRKTNMHVQQTEIPSKLRQMVDMLVDEEARQEDNTTGVCMEYFLKNGVLQYLVNVCEKSDYPVGIRGEAIRTIANMVDLLDDRFLVHNAVHKPTIKLLRFCVLDERLSDVYHEDLVDLMYIICSKIHGFPALLNIFFHDKQWLTTPQKPQRHIDPTTDAISQEESLNGSLPSKEQPKKPEYEFLLFTYLLRFVHREGRAGDFARTGLLFIMEMATNQLGEFILESDFATIMAAGLGALYSQLPRKLVIKDEEEINAHPASYLLGQDLDPRTAPSGLGVEVSSSPEFKYQLDSFLKLLEFCQDVLTRCPNQEISLRLLQSIRTIFLENILYPSILECSDIDGSAVAVISYIDLILQTLQQEDLADVVVRFLMDESDDNENGGSEDKAVNRNMNSSNNVFAGIELANFQSSPYFTAAERFTLKDLIFSRLKSSSQPTVIATLKLLRTLISQHCRYSLRLLSICPDDTRRATDIGSKAPSTIISHHIREIELYFSLITAIDESHAEDVLSYGYEEYLQDIESYMDSDTCYQQMTGLVGFQEGRKGSRTPRSERRRSFKYKQRFEDANKSFNRPADYGISKSKAKLFRHRLLPTDPLLQILLGLLSHFFAQSSELNLALTGVISALAMCPYRSLEGWIAFRESDRTNPDDVLVLNANGNAAEKLRVRAHDIYAHFEDSQVQEDLDDDDDRSLDYGLDRNSTHMTNPTQFKSFPPFFTLFRTLTQQVDYYRSEIDGFDKLLQERRNGLMFVDVHPVSPTASVSVRRGSIHPTTTIPENNAVSSSTQGGLVASAGASSPKSGVFGRRASVLRPTNLPPPTPMKSISSSTTAAAAAMAAAAGSLMLGQQNSHISHSYPTLSNPILTNPLSPLAIHARRAQSIRIQPLFPSNFVTEHEEPILDLDEDDEDTFAPRAANPSQTRKMDKSTEISLSTVLNNVVILEETIKEFVAIMQVRRSLGIDEIRYT